MRARSRLWLRFRSLAGGAAGAGAPPLPSGLLAKYLFTEGSGTSVGDSSGNGNTGTKSNSAGWQAGGGLTLPTAGIVTLPTALGPQVKAFAVFLSQPIASFSSFSFLYSTGTDGTGGAAGFRSQGSLQLPYPEIFANADKILSGIPFYGNDVMIWSAGGVAPKLFLGGSEPVIYTAQPTNSTLVGGASNVRIGSWYQGSFGPVGAMECALLFDHEFSQAEATQVTTFGRYIATQRGRTVGYTNPSATRVLAGSGDSIMAGATATSPFMTTMTLANTWTRYNFGIPGQTLAQVLTAEPTRSFPLVAPGAPRSLFLSQAGTNDIVFAGATAASVLAMRVSLCTAALARGWRYLSLPLLSRGTSGGVFDPIHQLFNVLNEAYSWPSGASAVPASALPGLTATGNYLNGNFSDQVHPNDTGVAIEASGYAPYINAQA